jgi:hypothetical protein
MNNNLTKASNDIISILKKIKTENLTYNVTDLTQLYKPNAGYIYCLHNEVFNYYGKNVYKSK